MKINPLSGVGRFFAAAFVLISMLQTAACQALPSPREAANRLTEAHGGMAGWQNLKSVSIRREHKSMQGATDFHFNILAEYGTNRIYEHWEAPPGTVVWDGERAWSVDWPLAQRLSPRFVASIGFFLVNMPWMVQDPATRLISVIREAGPASLAHTTFIVLDVEFEADPVRKPNGLGAFRDHFRLFIDPETYLLAAVHQTRTHAGQLDNFGAGPDETFDEIYIPTNYIQINELMWPERYEIYSPGGELKTRGRFFDYSFDVEVDRALFIPPYGDPGLIFDNTSSYQRKPQVTSD